MVFRRFGTSNVKSVFLGAPEAEAEATANSRLSLFDVYEDYHGLFNELSHEKFIVLGRKGSGKSAFAEYVIHQAKSDPNLFADFVRKSETNLEHIVQVGREEGHEIERESLFKWVILTKILKLFAENQAIQSNKDYVLLLQFLKKNSGYVDIRNTEIKELVRKEGFEINIEYLKRFISSKLNGSMEFKSQKAPFYKLLPHLEHVITKVLGSDEERRNGNSYLLFFDDLDIGLSSKNKSNVDTLISLLRIAKYVNNEVFGKNGIPSKVIILLRDDIANSISGYDADTAKIFSSYSARIDWYQSEHAKSGNELELNIRKFINKRIANCFTKNGFGFNSKDPWPALIEESDPTKSQFKYILDGTLFRPRDLLLYFKPLTTNNNTLPLSRYDAQPLFGRYCQEFAQEFKNELSYFYDRSQVDQIFLILKKITAVNKCSYREALSIIALINNDLDGDDILEKLFNYSIIGNYSDFTGYAFFKFRESESQGEPYSIDRDKFIRVQNAIRYYLQKSY